MKLLRETIRKLIIENNSSMVENVVSLILTEDLNYIRQGIELGDTSGFLRLIRELADNDDTLFKLELTEDLSFQLYKTLRKDKSKRTLDGKSWFVGQSQNPTIEWKFQDNAFTILKIKVNNENT